MDASSVSTKGTIERIARNKYVWKGIEYDGVSVNSILNDSISPIFFLNDSPKTLKLSRRRLGRTGTDYHRTPIEYTISIYEPSAKSPTQWNCRLWRQMDLAVISCEKRENNSYVTKSINEKPIYAGSSGPLIECEFFHHNESFDAVAAPLPKATIDQCLVKDFERLLLSENLSDFTILVKGKEFHVHKAVLSVRSQYFEAMFQEHTQEFKEGKVEIEDVEVDVFKEILRFIYTGKVQDITKIAFDLIAPADRFQVTSLVTLCEKYIIINMTVDNITDILLLIDHINLDSLTNSAIQFLLNNQQLLKTEEFSNFLSTTLSPSLLSRIINTLVEEVC